MKKARRLMVFTSQTALPRFCILTVLFSLVYSLFYMLFKPIHEIYPTIDPKLIVYWHRPFLFRDGLEMPIMLVGSVITVIVGFYLVSQRHILKLFSHWTAWVLCLLLLVTIVLTRQSPLFSSQTNGVASAPIFAISLEVRQLAIVGFVAILLVVGYILATRKSLFRFSPWALTTAFIGLFLLIILALDVPSVYDYDYYIGPALKLMQGEGFKSFFMQYNVLGVFVFWMMMEWGMKLHQMQLTLAFIVAVWFGLYFLLALKLLRDQYLSVLFLLTLVITRFFGIYHDPIRVPSVLPIRLDLWVPLVLGAYYFGIVSPVTSLSFSLMYVLDSTFGLFYLVVYVLVVAILVIKKRQRYTFTKLSLIALPILLSIGVQYVMSGSLVSPASFLYRQLQLGFQPISYQSPFWLIFAFLPFALYSFTKTHLSRLKPIFLLLFAMGLTQLIYFYGRSHDNNLLNISGIFILQWFIFLRLLQNTLVKKLTVYWVGVVGVIVLTILFLHPIMVKVNRITNRLLTGKFIETIAFDRSIDENKNLFAAYPDIERVVILSQFDSYLNYRYGLKQIGFMTPFPIHVYVQEMTDFLRDLYKKGYHIVLWEAEMVALIEQINQTKYMENHKEQFALVNRGGYYEVTIIKGEK